MSRSRTLTYWSQGSGNSRRAVKTGTRWCAASVLNTRRVPVRVCACVMCTRLEWSSFTKVPTWRANQMENLVSFKSNCPSITWKNWWLTEREMIYHQPLLNNYNWKVTFLNLTSLKCPVFQELPFASIFLFEVSSKNPSNESIYWQTHLFRRRSFATDPPILQQSRNLRIAGKPTRWRQHRLSQFWV